MITDSWPLPAEETSFYLSADNKLSMAKPEAEEASVTYAYDPNDPVVRVDIDAKGLIADGPVDQRPMRDRDDVIYFVSDVLKEPVEVNGRMRAELYVSSDAPDTTFVVKLLDIYPDGYEAMMAWGPMMARYHKGFDQPEPLEKGKVYKLDIDLRSTSMVFNKGHRIGVYVASSDAGRYAVHPNTYEPIESYEEANVANNTIHLSAEHPSRVILPITELGAGVVYNPDKRVIARKTREWDK